MMYDMAFLPITLQGEEMTKCGQSERDQDTLRKYCEMKRLNILAALAVMLLTIIGCSTNPKPVTLPPGALNAFDATSYTLLMGAQAVINSVKADIAKLPPEAKPALNKAIASYNVAESSWQAYHAGASNDQAALTKAIQQATADAVTLLTQIGGTK